MCNIKYINYFYIKEDLTFAIFKEYWDTQHPPGSIFAALERFYQRVYELKCKKNVFDGSMRFRKDKLLWQW
jgi:truncated hemoglobin YjbI